MKNSIVKTIRYKPDTFKVCEVSIPGVRQLARYIKMNPGELSKILNGKRIISEKLKDKITAGVRDFQAPAGYGAYRKLIHPTPNGDE